jgi:hypothetical protein
MYSMTCMNIFRANLFELTNFKSVKCTYYTLSKIKKYLNLNYHAPWKGRMLRDQYFSVANIMLLLINNAAN